MSKFGKSWNIHYKLVTVAPLVHIKIDLSFFFSCNSQTCLNPTDSFTVKVHLTCLSLSYWHQSCGKGKVSFLSHTEHLLSALWKGILKIILKQSSCQASLLYLSIDAPRLFMKHKCFKNGSFNNITPTGVRLLG